MPIQHFLYLSALLFCIGLTIVISKRHIIANLMGIELMLNACNINFVAFNQYHPETLDGQVFTLFIMVVAAAEVAIALAIFIQVHKYYQTVDLEEVNDLKG